MPLPQYAELSSSHCMKHAGDRGWGGEEAKLSLPKEGHAAEHTTRSSVSEFFFGCASC